MPRISLPPFLKKLQVVTDNVSAEIAHWNEAGDAFIVEKSEGFEKALRQHFKGSLLTFIRQLHFYGFRKVDIKGEKWSFSHKCFRQELPHLIYEIRRKTRTETNDGVASQLEVQALRDHVGKLHDMVKQLQSDLRETREELAVLRHSVKRDAMNAGMYDYGMVSNGGDIMPKKQKSFEKTADKMEASSSMKVEPIGALDSNELETFDIEQLSSFLPFTDGSFESMSSNSTLV